MIKSFRHRGLKALYEGRRPAKIAPDHAAKLARILTALDRSSGAEGMDLPGFRLHPLKGARKGHFAVSVSGNLPSPKRSSGFAQAGWRVTFRFEGGHAVDVDYLDTH